MRDGQLQLTHSIHDADQLTSTLPLATADHTSQQQVESAIAGRHENHSTNASAAAAAPPSLPAPPARLRSHSDPSQCARCMRSAGAPVLSAAQQAPLPPLACLRAELQADGKPAAADSSITPPAKRPRRIKPAPAASDSTSKPRTPIVVAICGLEWRDPTQLVSLRPRLAALQVPGSATRHSFVQVCDLTQAVFHPADSNSTTTTFLKQYQSCKTTKVTWPERAMRRFSRMRLSSSTPAVPCAVLPAGSVTQIAHVTGEHDVKFIGKSVNACGIKAKSPVMDAAGVRQLLQLPAASKALDGNERKFPGLAHFVRVTLIDALEAWKKGKRPQQQATQIQSNEIAPAAAAAAGAASAATQSSAKKKRKAPSLSSEDPANKEWEVHDILDRREIGAGRVEYLGQLKTHTQCVAVRRWLAGSWMSNFLTGCSCSAAHASLNTSTLEAR